MFPDCKIAGFQLQSSHQRANEKNVLFTPGTWMGVCKNILQQNENNVEKKIWTCVERSYLHVLNAMSTQNTGKKMYISTLFSYSQKL